MPVAGIFNRQFVQAKLFLHDFKLGRLRIRKSDPNKAVGLINKEMNLVNRDIGELASVLIGDTIDEHCGNLPYELKIKIGASGSKNVFRARRFTMNFVSTLD
jgi:hypothetical protein